jgi:hypothetical protein
MENTFFNIYPYVIILFKGTSIVFQSIFHLRLFLFSFKPLQSGYSTEQLLNE